MAFNPDEYLKESFNPDAYIAEFNPDEYLSGETQPKSLVDQIPGLAPEVQYVPPTMGERAVGAGEGALNVLTGLAGGVFGGPVGAANTIIGNITSDQNKPVQQGFMEGMEALTYHPKTEYGEELQRKYIAPTMEGMMAVAPVFHGEISAKSSAKMLHDNITGGKALPKPTATQPEQVSKFGVDPQFIGKFDDISKGEQTILENTMKLLDDKIVKINESIKEVETDIGRTGIASDEHITALQHLEEALNKTAEDRARLEVDLYGDKTKLNELLAERKQAILDENKKQVEQVRDSLTPEPEVQKTSPTEIALEKINEAAELSKEQLADRILETSDKLDNLEAKRGELPGQEYSALREALNRELDAYEQIAKGEKPDLTWAEKTAEKPVEKPTFVSKELPTHDEVANLLRDKKTMREVFEAIKEADIGTKGQKQLIKILDRIERIKTATFSFGTAIERNGKLSKGLYNATTHGVELHAGGSLKTVLHEAAHAATHHLLQDATSKPAKAMQALFDTFKDKTKDDAYGFTDVHEFVSEALTSARFQEILSKMDSRVVVGGKVLKMWEGLKEIIKEGLGIKDKEVFTALDDALDLSHNLLEYSRNKDQTFFQKLSDKLGKQDVRLDIKDEPTVRSLRGTLSRNFFGTNTLEGMYRNKPEVQQAFRHIREATETADKIVNELWYNTKEQIAGGKVKFFDTLSKVKDASSPFVAISKASKADMAILHDLFKKGFEQEIPYAENLARNGEHLSKEQVKIYNTLSKMFEKMYDNTVRVQDQLGKKHRLPYREGWYPAKRVGTYTVELAYRGNKVHTESFKTKQAADMFRRKISNGKNLKYIEVSDVIEKGKEGEYTANSVMAEIISENLAKKFPKEAGAIQERIDALMDSINSRGGKLGYHHQHRTNVPGYRGSELFRSAEDLGGSFKEGIQAEVNNFGVNLKALIIKTKLSPILADKNLMERDPVGYSVISQMHDSALGRNKELLGEWEKQPVQLVDKIAGNIAEKVLGKEFHGRDNTVLGHTSNTAMRIFYSAKMMAKPVFVVAQLLTTPMAIPEMARTSGHTLGAFYSFGKGISKLLTGNKELWDQIKADSQYYNVTEAQFRESMNLEKHTGKEGRAKKVLNFMEDYIFFGKVGQAADATSRLVSYATAYEHFRDVGIGRSEAAYQARLVADKAMNVYDTANAAPVFEKLGAMGRGLKPLSSFSLNQLGNFVSYLKEAKQGNFGPAIAFGLISTATGGLIGLPFIQEYERFRKIADQFFDITMPSILEIMSGDESFLDRLHVTDQDMKDVITYGAPAFTGIDLSSSMRSNETIFSLMAAIALGQEDAIKLMPILSATGETVAQLPKVAKTLAGKSSVAEGRKAIDTMVAGPIGYGAKEALGLNETKFMGESTGMMPVGKEANADMPRTELDKVAGYLGTRSIAQKKQDQKMFELALSDKKQQERIKKAATMLNETGDSKYVGQLVDLGLDDKQIKNLVMTGAYTKNIDQDIRYYRNKQGTIDKRKALKIFNFGIGGDE